MAAEEEKNNYPRATPTFVAGTLLTYIAGLFLLMAFCSPYWIESYEESYSSFKNMGLWEYCFNNFVYPYYQFPQMFEGCHNIFSHEYYVLRDYLLPPWLMAVQTFVTLAFIFVFGSLTIMSCSIVRWPLETVLQYEWLLVRISLIGCGSSSLMLFLAVAIFGGNAYRRDWLMYPKFNVLSWSYSFAVIACIVLLVASLVLRKEAKRSYDARLQAKNLVMQMQMQEPGYLSGHHSNHPRSQQGYI